MLMLSDKVIAFILFSIQSLYVLILDHTQLEFEVAVNLIYFKNSNNNYNK